jgi:hypothetical protein
MLDADHSAGELDHLGPSIPKSMGEPGSGVPLIGEPRGQLRISEASH